VSRYTISQAVPHLLKLYKSPDEAPNRPPVLMLLSDVVSAARDSTSIDKSVDAGEVESPLAPFKDEVLGVVASGLKSSATVRPALDGIKGLITTKGLLTDEELGFVVHSVNEIIRGDPEDSDNARYNL
jgi:DNA repair/transcription protein MET18/MMS19